MGQLISSDQFLEQLKELIPNLPTRVVEMDIRLRIREPVKIHVISVAEEGTIPEDVTYNLVLEGQ